jgi:hypothetical protein
MWRTPIDEDLLRELTRLETLDRRDLCAELARLVQDGQLELNSSDSYQQLECDLCAELVRLVQDGQLKLNSSDSYQQLECDLCGENLAEKELLETEYSTLGVRESSRSRRNDRTP